MNASLQTPFHFLNLITCLQSLISNVPLAINSCTYLMLFLIDLWSCKSPFPSYSMQNQEHQKVSSKVDAACQSGKLHLFLKELDFYENCFVEEVRSFSTGYEDQFLHHLDFSHQAVAPRCNSQLFHSHR